MVGSRVVAFQAQLDSLYEMLAFIREESGKSGFTPEYISKIELASEEALVNIINYGFPDTPQSEASIDIECSTLETGGIRIVIRDQGIPYNPLETPISFNPKAPADERAIGGYGVFFILNLMDKVTYSREEGANLLTLIKVRP